ncbi:hypothetical protein CsSME_00030578 [Camellia sinensis var. sinensis]
MCLFKRTLVKTLVVLGEHLTTKGFGYLLECTRPPKRCYVIVKRSNLFFQPSHLWAVPNAITTLTLAFHFGFQLFSQ